MIEWIRKFQVAGFPFGSFAFHTCGTCGALVEQTDLDLHTTWHQLLDGPHQSLANDEGPP